MHNILSLILEAKKKRIEILRKNRQALLSLIKKMPVPVSFKKAIKREGKMSFIGEIKQASPSAGLLRKNFSLVEIAKVFQKQKVNGISVVTEEEFFLGKMSYIEETKKITNLPILRKDFIFEDTQILESRAVGADAVLLIMRILDEERFVRLYNLSKELGMEVLVEVSTEKELRKVFKLGVDIVGINNRNLHTLEVDLNKTQELIPFIPPSAAKVSESGITTFKDILWLKGLGVDAVLVGEVLMRAENIEEKIRELHIDA
ncbi:MAG: indole-3-glycerol phosphate synthase TrpC [Candidatus Omnitrophica bacterium]|nr:indole-3-glycerol phosphate synthase TrpC [Candidatus Omnitrophota bacterium]MBU1524405.1 indole-3-glycerol phosphate synthase TrpC [Candidatus Omnitrophota bacterium]MBU2436979.1 indole-3-glycerol phosphate synthase TrpC [Candidatus Omnitrophota bacterium]